MIWKLFFEQLGGGAVWLHERAVTYTARASGCGKTRATPTGTQVACPTFWILKPVEVFEPGVGLPSPTHVFAGAYCVLLLSAGTDLQERFPRADVTSGADAFAGPSLSVLEGQPTRAGALGALLLGFRRRLQLPNMPSLPSASSPGAPGPACTSLLLCSPALAVPGGNSEIRPSEVSSQ